MDPITIMALGGKLLGGLFGASAARAQGRAEQQAANRNAYIAETRARQAGATSAAAIGEELAALRNTMAANGQVGGMEFWTGINRIRRREARIEISNERQMAADYRDQGRGAMARGNANAVSSLGQSVQAGFSIWDYARNTR